MGKRGAHREVVATANAATGAASATSGAAGAATGTEAANGTAAANGAELPAELLPHQSWSELIALRGAPPCTADEYLCSMAPSVCKRLVAFLSQGQEAGGILLQGALEDQQPLQIDSKNNHGDLQSFKEHWRWSQCQHSLGEHGLYEAPGNGFWLNVDRPLWKEELLPATGLTFKNIDGGRMMWSDAKFERSGDRDTNRHYFLSVAIPTAVVNASDVDDAAAAAAGEEKKGLRKLPCLASRACLAGWYSQMDDALRANNKLKIKKLFQAMLSLPMRLRVAPDETQIALDSITYSEDLHVAKSASSDAFFDFAEKSCPLLKKTIADNPNHEALAVAKEGQKLGITYHGAPLERNMARALLEVAPYVGNGDVRSALKELENISSVLSDQSKCAGLFGMVTKHYGKSSIAAVGAVVEAVSAIRISILYQDIPSERAMTKDFLFGGSKTKKVLVVGCGQMRALGHHPTPEHVI
jgi:hypothetical protein